MLNIRVCLPTIWKRSWSRSVISIFLLIWSWWVLILTIISGCRARLLFANSHWRWMGSVSGNFILRFFFWPIHLGDRSIESQAQTNFAKCIKETEKSPGTRHISPFASHIERRSSPPLPPLTFSANSLSSDPEYNSTNEQQIGVDLEGLVQSGNFTLKVIGLQKPSYDSFSFDSDSEPLSTLDLRLKADATLVEIMVAIKDAGVSLMVLSIFFSTSEAGALGFNPPTWLYEEPELRISVTEGDSVYDATVPGGLKVNR